VLVGFDFADDAGVYRMSDTTALVQTVDFFTPIVDDPYTFGQIAAVNSLSDVYAMGGGPLTSLAIVCFAEKGDLDVLERILAGGLSKMVEAGCTVIGGHSIRDDEMKFGYSVTGTINPGRVLANRGAKPGDALLLTKALGTGVISTAIKKAKGERTWMEAAIGSMTALNKTAAEVITTSASRDGGAARPKFEVHALTDITGFGLIGHAREMALASGVGLRIHSRHVPLLPGAIECVHEGLIPGGLKNNREFAERVVRFAPEVPEDVRTLLFDPQTAGGLLIAVAGGDAKPLEQKLAAASVPVSKIGEVIESTKPLIQID